MKTRYNAEINETIELRAYFFKNGRLIDPFEISKVEILDSDGVVVLETINPPNIIKISTGSFKIVTSNTWNTIPDKKVFDRWTYKWVDGGDDVTVTMEIYIYNTGEAPADKYITVDDIRAEGISPETYSDERVQQSINYASIYIDKMTGQWFESREKQYKIDGKYQSIHFFYVPIISISSITIDGDILSPDDYTPYDSINDRGNPKIKFDSRIPKGNLNVEIQGNFGYLDEDGNTPVQIKYACKKLTYGNLAFIGSESKKESDFQMRLVKEKTDGHSYELANMIESGSLTGDAEIDNILVIHRRPPVMGAV